MNTWINFLFLLFFLSLAHLSSSSLGQISQVYVAGIPEACTEQEFRDFFAQYGNVTSTKLSDQSKNGTSDLSRRCGAIF